VGRFQNPLFSRRLWKYPKIAKAGHLVRVQGISPFLFTLRLVAFNFASYPALSMHYRPAWTCSSGVARSSYLRETSSFRIHRTPELSSFLLQSRPSRIPDLRRATRIMERGLSSVSYTVSDPPAPSSIPGSQCQ